MIYRILVILLLQVTIIDISLGQTTQPSITNIYLGDTKVILEMYKNKPTGYIYAHVHENEVAALEAGLKMLEQYGGSLLTLKHTTAGEKSRYIYFKHKNTEFRIDPNRIFTNDKVVLKKTIHIVKGTGKIDTEVLSMVSHLADEIWKILNQYDFIVAIHNNVNLPTSLKSRGWFRKEIVPESFSILSFAKKNDISSLSSESCSDIYINPKINNSEFFIVTQRQDFDNLMHKRYNVVLQNQNPIDDGSLSVFAASKNKRYANSEAKMGRSTEQLEMLKIFLIDPR